VVSAADQRAVIRFTDHHDLCCNPTRLAVEAQALGVAYGSTGYTTREQADRITGLLALEPTSRLADIGAGSGWPSLYLAATTGCTVVGTDLPIDGLRRAIERARIDGADGRTAYVQASGKRQPLRSGGFDAVVHTDVLCCLGPKETVLRECLRLLRPGGRMAFTTIHVTDDLDRRAHRRAVRAGPWQVATRRPYAELVARAGFTDVRIEDVTGQYGATQRTWLEQTQANERALRGLAGDMVFELGQRERRRTRAAIDEGLLRRVLIAARRPWT
jgi:cyclopropane fatty-acyl-phospholipid synthase-like methyltransferase